MGRSALTALARPIGYVQSFAWWAAFVWVQVGASAAQGLPNQAERSRTRSAERGRLEAPPAAQPMHQRAFKKVREGSVLRRDRIDEQRSEDSRSVMERARDAAVATHYGRVALLDVISDLARQTKNSGLAKEVAAVRLREEQRYRAQMKRLREQFVRASLSGRL